MVFLKNLFILIESQEGNLDRKKNRISNLYVGNKYWVFGLKDHAFKGFILVVNLIIRFFFLNSIINRALQNVGCNKHCYQ